MKRNPDATCANCPYWAGGTDHGECRAICPSGHEESDRDWAVTHKVMWCGGHPEFWQD